MRCPACGATNPDSAAWCGQCLLRFGASPQPAGEEAEGPAQGPGSAGPETEAPARADAPALDRGSGAPATELPATAHPAASPSVIAGVEGPPAAAATTPADASGGRLGAGFVRTDAGIAWECVACGTTNPLEANDCSVCGTRMAARFEPAPPPPRYDAGRARIAEGVLPGLGHILAGRTPTGVARGLLALLWLAGAIGFAQAGASGVAAAAPLLAGAALLWCTGPNDLGALLAGRRPLLDGRRLGWLTLGVTGLVLLLGLVAALTGS